MEDETQVFGSLEDELAHYRSLSQSLSATLEDTRSALEDFQSSSKELEYELERELASTEVREKELKAKVERLGADVEDWKGKYQNAVRENSSSMTKMQREVETLRASQQQLKDRLRDMENDNDELEKSERAMETTLQDLEQRHDRAIERATLLEDELINKAQLEEEIQRVKDELRDTLEELAIFRGYKEENDSIKKDMANLHEEIARLRTVSQEQEAQIRLSRTIRASSPTSFANGTAPKSRPLTTSRIGSPTQSHRLSTLSASSDDLFSDKDESTPRKRIASAAGTKEIHPPPNIAPSPSPTRRIPSNMSRLPVSPSRIPSPSITAEICWSEESHWYSEKRQRTEGGERVEGDEDYDGKDEDHDSSSRLPSCASTSWNTCPKDFRGRLGPHKQQEGHIRLLCRGPSVRHLPTCQRFV
ncbi:hypothetical protein BT69DRAFT_413060 [Atractiella rhizophila]|nr:hypothetical protein BT69DRAFT_413060 [Atractiella rhizophila]